MTKKTQKDVLTVVQFKSTVGTTEKVKANVRGLGLHRIRDRRVLEDTPAVRGMINAVRHIVKIEE